MKRNYRGQMSDSFVVGILLSLTGGFQDAYTYVCRGKVFANAQTGNIVLMGKNLAEGQWAAAVRYLLPVAAFVGGIYLAQKIRYRYRESEKIHWRQLILLLEALILFAVGWIPAGAAMAANILVSFSCAMQVDSFRKIRGTALATTMCIGNLRTATDLLCAYQETGDEAQKRRSVQCYVFILIFAAGAALGGAAVKQLGEKAVWICCAGLFAAFLILFIREELEEEKQQMSGSEGLAGELKDIGRALRQGRKGERR